MEATDDAGNAFFGEDLDDVVAGSDRDRRLGDDDRRPLLMILAQLAHRGEDEGQVGMAVAAPRRRADRDEHRLGPFDPCGEVGGEAQAAALDIGFDQRVQARLPDRHPAILEGIDLVRILVDAAHLMAEIGEAGARHEADIASPDHRDAHYILQSASYPASGHVDSNPSHCQPFNPTDVPR